MKLSANKLQSLAAEVSQGHDPSLTSIYLLVNFHVLAVGDRPDV